MNSQLRWRRCRSKCQSMPRWVINSFVMFAMLFGSIGTPAIAASQSSLRLAIEAPDLDFELVYVDDQSSQSPAGLPDTHHNHGTHGLPASYAGLAQSGFGKTAGFHFALFPAMSSLSQAPPIEPPSA